MLYEDRAFTVGRRPCKRNPRSSLALFALKLAICSPEKGPHLISVCWHPDFRLRPAELREIHFCLQIMQFYQQPQMTKIPILSISFSSVIKISGPDSQQSLLVLCTYLLSKPRFVLLLRLWFWKTVFHIAMQSLFELSVRICGYNKGWSLPSVPVF